MGSARLALPAIHRRERPLLAYVARGAPPMTASNDKTRGVTEAAVTACYSSWAESYFAEYYENAGAYPPVHRMIVRDLVAASGARTLLDAGCGPASMLRGLGDLGAELYGFDLTPEMIVEARKVM